MRPENKQGNLKHDSLFQEATLLWEYEGTMVKAKTEPHLVRKRESPENSHYAQHSQPGSCCPDRQHPANRNVRAGPQLGAEQSWAAHCRVWGQRKEKQVKGLKGTDQATKLAAETIILPKSPCPVSSSQVIPGAILRPATLVVSLYCSPEMRAAKA